MQTYGEPGEPNGGQGAEFSPISRPGCFYSVMLRVLHIKEISPGLDFQRSETCMDV